MNTPYSYTGAQSLVLLHEHHLREFLTTWKRAKEAGLELPKTDDPSYASLQALLQHVLRAARGYMVWSCKVLELPDPGLRPTPAPDAIESEADAYLKHVLERWRDPLREVPPEAFERPNFASNWGVEYCVDAMLEHAVMHPIRHTYQLQGLMNG